MSAVGIDFGAQSTKIGVARNKGIDIITNETSNRQTPSAVGFGPKSRYLGEAAKTQEISNLKNTISSLKRLAGRSINDPEVEIEQEFITAPIVEVNGQVGCEVTYRGEKQRFTATQLIAMYFTKIRDTAGKELKLPVSDVVIGCPPWFADSQRRAILDAAEIANLKLLRLFNDNTAIAMGYGITKSDLPEGDQQPRRICFIDIGNSDYSCSIVEFKKGELTVKSTTFDRHFGGRNIDKALVDHFAAEFKEKYKIDIKTNAKAKTRVAAAAEKLKKVLSANAQAPINIESCMDDKDVRGMLKREELEELMKPLLDRVTLPIEQALAEAKLTVDQIDAIEMVGGCTRVPSIKEKISKFFGKNLSFTLNQDEAIARGCAFACAVLSPAFRVRDFTINDIINYPIEFVWEQLPGIPDEGTSLLVFNKGNKSPSTKVITFYRKQPFDVEARYAQPELLPGKINPWIGKFSVKDVKPNAQDDFMICRLNARVNLHGILNVESAYSVEEQEVEEPVAEPKEGDAMDTDQANGSADAVPKTRKVKKWVRQANLPLSAATASLDMSGRAAAAEAENAMFMEDKLVMDTEDKKNELEAFIYELRGKVDDIYADFASEDEKTKIKEKCEKTEDWLYEDGEDASKAQYIAKMDDLRFAAGPVIGRYNEKIENERQARMKKQEEVAARRTAEEQSKKRTDTEMKDAPAPPAPQPEDIE